MRRSFRSAFVLAAAMAALTVGAGAQVLGPPTPAAPSAFAPAAAPAANWRQVMSELKVTPRGEMLRKKHHLEIGGAMADGRPVTVSFDLQGRIWEIEIDNHDKHRYGEDRPVDGQAAVEAVRRAGFRDPSLRELRRNHAVVGARTDKAEPVELHVDRGGVVYKQVWIRDYGWAR